MIKLKVFLLMAEGGGTKWVLTSLPTQKKGFPCAAQAPAAEGGAENEPQVN